jgi:serine/threonine protein kinase
VRGERSSSGLSRWIEVTASPFPHEAEGLNRIRELLPSVPPFRAWSNFEFRDGQGKWHEVDLLVLGRRRLHLLELKYYSGAISGDDYRWLREGHRAEDSPLKLARRKAQRLASKLREELFRLSAEQRRGIVDARDRLPFVQEAVYLHHPETRCNLRPASRIDLFGLDGKDAESGLPGISQRLLEAMSSEQSVTEETGELVATLMERIGVVQRRQLEVGSWMIDDAPGAEGRDWQDWPASHRFAGKERARIRFHVSRPGATEDERRRVRQVAEHEYRIMSRLTHDGLLRPRDIVDSELGVGLVYPDDQTYQRLDLWLAEQAGSVSAAEQLAIVRQVAEALIYAHANGVVHRGLTPSAVRIARKASGALRVQVGDWQAAGRVGKGAGSSTPSAGVTNLLGDFQPVARAIDRNQNRIEQDQVDIDRRQAEAFQAPEGLWYSDSDRVRLDVFALGALTYFIVTGRPPASDRHALRQRLEQDQGLDLAADLPQVPSPLRTAVLEATRPVVSKRLPDVRSFLEPLAAAEGVVSSPDDDASSDPLEAVPGAVIAGRFQLERRLGAGSTAVGLRVKDLNAKDGPDSLRVLKVAIDDAAAARVSAEAEVLAKLNSPRLVRMVEPPLEIGGRRTLVLESAGDETLAEALRARKRLSIDLLERWGEDLLEALGALERAGIDHRDIKPANLGVREGRGDRVKHLVLFDFSLSRAGLAATRAGTPPYLDPFLELPGRNGYDTAAERYSAGVVLFEMATGSTPIFGDGLSDPTVVRDEALISEAMFDESVAPPLVAFFKRTLARDANARFHTAGEMLVAWKAAIRPVARTAPADASRLAEEAKPTTPLAEAGLSPRALSAVEPLGVATVADLVAVDPVRLSRLGGVAEATRVELRDLSRLWRERFGPAVTGRSREGDEAGALIGTGLPAAVAGAELLLIHAGEASAQGRRRAARLLLGLDPGIEAFASQIELGSALGVTRARAAQLVAGLQKAWEHSSESRELLSAIAQIARSALLDLGGVATAAELSSAVLAAMAPGESGATPAGRIGAGLLRVALDRLSVLERAHRDAEPLNTRRRDGRIAILATEPSLLDAADALGAAADELVGQVASADAIVPSRRASVHLRAALARVASGVSIPVDDDRLVRLGAGLAAKAAVSGAGDLYHRELPAPAAISVALRGLGATERIRTQELRDRVRARFPALPTLPDRPRLDQLVEEAGLGLIYDETDQTYHTRTSAPSTAGLESRLPTLAPGPPPEPVLEGHLSERLRKSRSERSFLALGVDVARLPRALEVLQSDFNAEVLDLTRTLLDALREAAGSADPPIPWEAVLSADAAPRESRDSTGLHRLVGLALPKVEAAVQAVLGGAARGSKPLVLTEAAALARYGHLGMLSHWTDLTSPRADAAWLLVPQLLGNQGAVIDGHPIPLAAPGQYLRLDAEWVDAHARAGRAREAGPA